MTDPSRHLRPADRCRAAVGRGARCGIVRPRALGRRLDRAAGSHVPRAPSERAACIAAANPGFSESLPGRMLGEFLACCAARAAQHGRSGRALVRDGRPEGLEAMRERALDDSEDTA